MALMNSMRGFPVSMNFVPPPGVAPMDASAFLTPQEKYLATKPQGGAAAPAAGGVPGAGGGGVDPLAALPGGAAQGGGGSSGMMDAIMKLFMSGMMGAP